MPEITALVKVEKLTPADLFKPEIIKPILELIREEATAQAALLDISTPGNRSDLASLAYKVGQSKTFIEKQRVGLVGDRKRELKIIDQNAGESWDYLESLQKEIRKPLTDWENAEKQRVADHEAALTNVQVFINTAKVASTVGIDALILSVKEFEDRDWQEFSKKASDVINGVLEALVKERAIRQTQEDEQAELARLRYEAVICEQKDREDRIAREATEKAHQEAAEAREKAQREALARFNQAKAEKEAAEARAAKAEQDAKDAADKAKRDAVEAAERAERERKAAVEAEAKRIADAAAAEKAAADARENNRKHSAKINNQAAYAIAEIVAQTGNVYDIAQQIVTAIAKGQIPHVKVVY